MSKFYWPKHSEVGRSASSWFQTLEVIQTQKITKDADGEWLDAKSVNIAHNMCLAFSPAQWWCPDRSDVRTQAHSYSAQGAVCHSRAARAAGTSELSLCSARCLHLYSAGSLPTTVERASHINHSDQDNPPQAYRRPVWHTVLDCSGWWLMLTLH